MNLFKTFVLAGLVVFAILSFTDTGYASLESPYGVPSFNGRFYASVKDQHLSIYGYGKLLSYTIIPDITGVVHWMPDRAKDIVILSIKTINGNQSFEAYSIDSKGSPTLEPMTQKMLDIAKPKATLEVFAK